MFEEFIRLLREQFYVPLYFITWVIAVYRYKRYFDTPLKYFPIFIIYTFFTELLGILIKYSNDFQFFSDDRYAWHNVIIYNVYQVITFVFFYWVYRNVIKETSTKKWIKYGTYICVLTYVVNSFITNPLHNNLIYGEILGSIILVIVVLLYFKEKIAEKNPFPQWQNLLFWTSLGLLVFYIFSPFIMFVGMTQQQLYYELHFRQLLLFLIVFMYSCFIIGFLLGKRKAFR